MTFALHLPIVISYLSKGTIDCHIFTSKILDLLLPFGTEGAGGSESYPPNDITNRYIYDAFLIIYLSVLLFLFFHFLVLQRSQSEIHKGCNSIIL